jgi:hypothetical protein
MSLALKKIVIEVIPQASQRYETIGDYWWEGDTLHIRVSDCGDPRYAACVALHEFVESTICQHRGIDEPQIMAFDKAFEASRKVTTLPSGEVQFVEGPDLDAEPGDDPAAPYGKEHRFAENLERLYAAELGVNWAQYDADLCKVWHQQPSS